MLPTQPAASSAAWAWLGVSFVLAVVGANAVWLLRKIRPDSISPPFRRLVPPLQGPRLHQTARLLYYVGLPFAALLLGRDAVTARLLGLQPFRLVGAGAGSAVIAENWLDWARDAGSAAAAGAAVSAFLLTAWWTYRRALVAADFHQVPWAVQTSGWAYLREATYHEVHWSFYRNAPLLALQGLTDEVYLGIWMGLGIVALEAALNPAWRRGLAAPNEAPERLMRAALALLSAITFWQTQNLWLAILLHLVISWGLSAVARGARPSAR